ncbi:MAG: alanine dehydrogenase [Acidimicrobiales bacterium]|nr:alanine dehydrogenase [Acidimicrobiales bacterium]
MQIGVPTEIKANENRVGLTPESVAELVGAGHGVVVQQGAGDGSGFPDAEYAAAGGEIVVDAEAVFSKAELIVKVKEPQAIERARLTADHTLFTYLHLAPDPDQAADLVDSGATCIAYESVIGPRGDLALLAPMSQVAGRLAVQAGARSLEKVAGGSGVLLGGVPGVEAGKVTVIGGGFVGKNAIEMAVGLGARVVVLDRNPAVLEALSDRYGPAIQTVYSTTPALERHVAESDLVIGAVLVRNARTPHLITKAMLASMRPGSVIVDVAIDQGGCAETSRPTTHADPTYVVDGVVHYCVANMPGAVPRTSTLALNNATLPYVMKLANGVDQALAADAGLAAGLTVKAGKIVEPTVAAALPQFA